MSGIWRHRSAIPLFVDKQEITMTTNTKPSAVVLAAATFAATLAAGGSASANIVRGLGHGPVVVAGGPTGAGLARQGTIVGAVGSGVRRGLPINPQPSQNGGSNGNGHLVSCSIGTGCTVTSNGDHDRDRDRNHDRDRDHDGYYHGRGYGWGYQPPIVVEGVPGAVAVPAPVQVVPAPVQAVPARVPAPAASAGQGPCNCLTKQSLPDGSLLFQDVCTKESAIAPPQAAGAR
jgi:hypothetical protein